MSTTTATLAISLETDCDHAICKQFSWPLLDQLRDGYETCAVLEIPGDLDEWRGSHRTARKRADRASRRGYVALALKREKHSEEIHEINTSAPKRQGRPMSNGYTAMVRYTPLPNYPCGRHAIRTTGVYDPGGTLVAYLTMYRAGDLALVSQILGHADHLQNEIMFLLFRRALGREILRGPGVVVYNRWDSGQPGLREFKTRLGFSEANVEWHP